MQVFIGQIFHSLALTEIESLPRAIIAVAKGKIAYIHSDYSSIPLDPNEDPTSLTKKLEGLIGSSIESIKILPHGSFLLPGLIDTHIHGTGYDLPLLEWLNKYTFPSESTLSDDVKAAHVFDRCVERSLASGTTTACYYATIHLAASKILVDTMMVCMDSNSPEYYCESREDSVRETREFIEYTKRVGGGFVKPVITPRFAPSCSAELLGDLGQLVKDDGCLMQTHISETKAECSWVSSIFEGKGYGQVYDDAGLLGPGSIMAHCIHLSETEIARFIEVDAGISHCPTSNLMLESGILDLRALFDRGILKIGLGTDVAGGFSPSILEAMRHAILSSKALKITKGAEYLAIGFVEAFWMATRGGARVLGVEKNIGGFEVGKEFDVLEIEMGSGRGRVDLFEEGAMGMLEKFVYLGSEANIVDVWVGGRKVV